MNIVATYSFTGAVPPEGWYFCMYVSMLGECSFAMAQVEYDITKDKNVWRRPEFGSTDTEERSQRPYCYFTFTGTITDDTIMAMQRNGRLMFEISQSHNNPTGERK